MPPINLQQLEEELRSTTVDTPDAPRDVPDDGARLADARREIRNLRRELRRAERRADAVLKPDCIPHSTYVPGVAPLPPRQQLRAKGVYSRLSELSAVSGKNV